MRNAGLQSSKPTAPVANLVPENLPAQCKSTMAWLWKPRPLTLGVAEKPDKGAGSELTEKPQPEALLQVHIKMPWPPGD